jgi:hypothetical protein
VFCVSIAALFIHREGRHLERGQNTFMPANITQIGNQLDDVEAVYFSTVEQVALDGFMYIDKSTLQSLQIFNHVRGFNLETKSQ